MRKAPLESRALWKGCDDSEMHKASSLLYGLRVINQRRVACARQALPMMEPLVRLFLRNVMQREPNNGTKNQGNMTIASFESTEGRNSSQREYESIL